MHLHSVTQEDHSLLAVPLKDYFNCTIEFAGKVRSCSKENVLGSFYSPDEMPQYCYTLYSLWGKPNAERERIPKGSIMRFRLYLNSSRRPIEAYNTTEHVGPLYNPPSDPSVQIAVHSPYFLPSPYLEGTSFLGGRSYELRIQLSESHLLPLPYQTNCTDYMTVWKKKGGKAPVNQLGVIQECRLNAWYNEFGCIPVNFDYPHSYNICKACAPKEKCLYVEPSNDCTRLADDYNQPCDSMTYNVDKEDKVITRFIPIKSKWGDSTDGISFNFAKHDCDGNKIWRRECSTIDILLPFDRFTITNITYNPKFESLELFSVIGGYMGMWLGISLLAIFDSFTDIFLLVRIFINRRKGGKQQHALKSKLSSSKKFKNSSVRRRTTAYNVW